MATGDSGREAYTAIAWGVGLSLERSDMEQSTMGPAAAESVERRVGTKGNADQQSTHWTQRQARVSQALDCMRRSFCRLGPT